MKTSWLVIGIGYALWLALIVGLLLRARTWATAEANKPAAQQAWDGWKDEVQRQNQEQGSVVRKIPRSDQPPAVILLNQRFGGVLTSCLIVGSFFYAFAAFVGWGVISQRGKPAPGDAEQV